MSDQQMEDTRRLEDILAFINHLEGILVEINKGNFEDNITAIYAVERLLHNIGEATVHISEELKQNNSDVSWSQIRGMRNILAHGYDVLDYSTLWETSQIHIPVLKKQVLRILKIHS